MSDEARSSEQLTQEFTALLSALSMRDAFYMQSRNPGLYYKRDMGSVNYLQCIHVDRNFREKGESAFDSFISSFEGSAPGPGALFTFLFVFENYNSDAALAELLRRKQTDCEERGILTDFAVIDLASGTYFILNGGKMTDKKLARVITDALEQYRRNPDDMRTVGNSAAATAREAHRAVRPAYRLSPSSPVAILIAVNVAVFFTGMFMEILGGRDLLLEFGILNKTLVAQGEYWRLITATFLHADFAHLFGNMYFLFILGRNLLGQYSNAKFLTVYFLSGLSGSLLSCALSSYQSLGASGAIMGLGGVLIYKVFFGKHKEYFRYVGNYLAVGLMVLFNLGYGLFNTGIDNYGHFGGFFCGFLLEFIFSRKDA